MAFVKSRPVVASDRLLQVLEKHERFLILMHDNPDPDAISSAWALQTLIGEKLDRSSRLIAGGAIVRAENRHMVDLLGVPIQLLASLDADQLDPVILVDCGSGSSNQLLASSAVRPLAIIDHHINSCNGTQPAFLDLRPGAAATASITGNYLREQGVEPGVKLATALLYAIRSETRGSETSYSPLDSEMVVWLTERADPELLAAIESAPLSMEWYSDLALALQCTTLFDDVALCFLPKAEGPEIVGEIADLLVRGKGIRRVLCAAVVNRDLLISVRTTPDAEDACTLVIKTVGELGSGGGHGRRAGGKIPNIASDEKGLEQLEASLREQWLRACGAVGRTPRQLISWRDIVEHI